MTTRRNILVVSIRPDVPAKNFKEFVAFVR